MKKPVRDLYGKALHLPVSFRNSTARIYKVFFSNYPKAFDLKGKMVHLGGEASNTLFEVLADWEHQLRSDEFIDLYDELEATAEPEEPQP